MKHRVQFEEVVAHLRQRQQELVVHLRAAGRDQDAIETQRQIEAAIGCLQLCEQYQTHPDSTITVLGWSHDRFGNFVAVDAGDGEPIENWRPVEANGQAIYSVQCICTVSSLSKGFKTRPNIGDRLFLSHV